MTILAVIFRIINAGLMMGIPLILGIVLAKRGKDGFRPIGIGAAVFILSQVGHIPFNQFLLMPGLKSLGIEAGTGGNWNLLLLGLALGLSAGLFEEIARFLAFKYWLNRAPHTSLPLKYGVGHGGVEAFILGVLALVALIQVIFLAGEGALLSFPADQAEMIQEQIAVYWDVPLGISLLGAWERISAMAFHVGASLFVFKAVRMKKISWLTIAVIGHTVLDAFAVIAVQKLNFVILESILFVFAAAWLIWAWTQRVIEEEEIIPVKQVQIELSSSNQQITGEQLEESRYDE